MEKIRKYWWIILVALGFFFGFMLKWFYTPADVQDELNRLRTENAALKEKHTSDSVVYKKTADSLVVVIDVLKAKNISKDKEIVRLRAKNKAKTDSVRVLDPISAVECFSDRTGVEAKLFSDSSVTTKVEAITISNVLFFERDSYESENMLLNSKSVVQDSIIGLQGKLIGVKDKRISDLTSDYYSSQKTITGLEGVVKKQKKNIHKKNAIIGILSGVGAALIIVSVVK